MLLDDLSFTDEAHFKERTSRALPQPGDLIITREAPMGEVCIIPGGLECCLGQRMVLIKPDLGKVDSQYLLYAMMSEYAQAQIGKSDGTGSIVSNLRIPLLKELLIPYKELAEQREIAGVLDAIDKKVELNDKISAELEAMAKLIYDYWFVQFDFPDANGKPYKSSGGKMVYNETLKREIPDGWVVEPLSLKLDIYDSIRIPMSGKERDEKQGIYPYYGATGIMDFVDDYIFDDDYILLAEDGSVMNEEGMPIVQFVWGKTWVNNHAHVLQAKNKSHNEFYFQLLKRIPVVSIKTGSIQMKINQANLMSYVVAIPSSDLIDKYSKFANYARGKLVNSIEETNKLAELRDWLLPMLMNGQVTVNSS
ncbi:restriction endonuclease subunit S [Luminiphilus sp.]|nr:restriction endonuclease subunit S [Luminiphilus sp.]